MSPTEPIGNSAAETSCGCASEESCSCTAHRTVPSAALIKTLARLAAGAIVYICALTIPFIPVISLALFIAAYLVIGVDILFRAARNIVKGKIFDEHLLMSIATIGAFAIGAYPEAVAVMLFYQAGELLEGLAVGRSKKSITHLLSLRPDSATILRNDTEEKVLPDRVNVGDILIVRPGERIPVDGVVLNGRSYADTSAITGESVPRPLGPGDPVYSGSINQSGVVTFRAEKAFAQSTVSKILEMVQSAAARKSPTEKFITRFARYYTPAVVLAAACIAAFFPLLFGGAFSDWLYRALLFLVISCPCALVISIPLAFFGGIGAASRAGILVKGGNSLDALRAVDTVVFDKTGTLTEGVFKVTGIRAFGAFTPDDVLMYAAHVESLSTHPVAKPIANAYRASGGLPAPSDIADHEEISGMGIKATVKGKAVLAGNRRMMAQFGVALPEDDLSGTLVYIAIDRTAAGILSVSDVVRSDAKSAVSALKESGIKKTVMLTGDRTDTAKQTADELGIGAFYAQLLPQDKVKIVEELMVSGGGKIAFVGDGINDAPVLAWADIGIAMGGLGADAAIEAADVVIMDDRLSRLADAIFIAHRTRRVVWQNIALALGVKLIVMALGALGAATMWEAVFADVGVALLAVLSALRTMHSKIKTAALHRPDITLS